jgi:hypothetical protein
MNSGHEHFAGTLAGFSTDSHPAENRLRRLCRILLPDRAACRGIWPRVGLLFLALCLIKALLLVAFRKHLFEIHWRFGGEPYDWVSEAGSYLLAVLVIVQLWKLGMECQAAGRRVVRAANACVLALGAAFILLTLHEGSNNYLTPIMKGVLTWKSLGWYLALDFCFRPPYLAAWVLLYALVYYGLARTGRGHRILQFTAICAGLYIAFCMGDVVKYRGDLVVAVCVGIASLFSCWRSRNGLGLVWVGLLALSAASSFVLFYGLSPRVSMTGMDPEFAVLTGTAIVLTGGISVLAWRFGFFSSWSWLLPFVFVTFLLLANVNYGAASNYNKLLCNGLTLPRYFLGELLVAGSCLIIAAGYRRWRPSGSMWWLDAVCLLLLAFALADLRLSQIMGVRLDWPALTLALGETPRMMWRLARPFLPVMLCALAIITLVYAMLVRALRRPDQPLQFGSHPRFVSGARFFLLSFVLLGLAGGRVMQRDKAQGQSALLLAETSPLWRRAVDPPLDEKTLAETAQLLGMDGLFQVAAVTQRPQRDMNVVLILQESSYNKYLSLFSGNENTQPLLAGYKDRMEVFPNFFMNFAGSIHARFAAFTGLYPVHNYRAFTLERVGVKSLFEVLHDRGYTCSLFYSSFFDYTGFRDFLNGRKVDELYDADTMPGPRTTKPVSWGLREEETLAAMQSRIKSYADNHQKFFLTYIPAAPHYPYDGTPLRFCKYQKGRMGDFTPLYLNEMLYMDWITSCIMDQLKDCGVLDQTLVIITGDHGEMLGADDGPIGHGWAVTPELANIPLIIMDPGNRGYRINRGIGSQVDLLPTILDLLGIPVPGDQLYQGSSLYATSAAANRTIYVNSFRQYAVIKGNQMIAGDREAGSSGNLRNVFVIDNEGARTTFMAVVPTNAASSPSISVFDRFQENLLHHYTQYREMVRQPNAKN